MAWLQLFTVFRGFWTVLIILGLVAALTGGFLLVCGVPFISHKLYKLGGAFLIAAGKKHSLCARLEFNSTVFMCSVRYTSGCTDTNTLLLSAVHTRHMTNTHPAHRAADVTLQSL